MLGNPQSIVDRLFDFQRAVRDALARSRDRAALSEVGRISAADTIYAIDEVVEPILEAFCEEWGRTTPLAVIAEGMVDESGREGVRLFPAGTRQEDAALRLIFDPIDGTRQIMYDKRSAWALAGVAPNRGPMTRLSDIQIAVMTELPTAKAGWADELWAVRGQGARARRVNLLDSSSRDLLLRPSAATGIDHGYASVANFFPGTKVLASQLMERIAHALIGPADVTRATVFDDQYITTAGQFYELMVGHDRFNADLRGHFYRAQGQVEGLCCHPYDCATMLIAQEAGVLITDGRGAALDAPLDTTTSLSWAAYANPDLRRKIEPIVLTFLREHGAA